MKKELIFAVIFGLLFGLIIAFGVWRLNTSLSNKVSSSPTPSPSNSDGQNSGNLVISKPNSFFVSKESSIQIEGITKSLSWVTISGETKDKIVEAAEDGGFSEELELTGGINQVLVNSFDEEGNISSKNLLLVHSSSFELKEGENVATSSADTAERVQERLQTARHTPTSYIGTITDIFENTIHVKNANDEIKQVAIETGTTFANEITKKDIKQTDLAIGDFVIGMGFINGNQVLHSSRIVVSTQPKVPTRQIHKGVVKEIKNKLLTLTEKEKDIELTFPKTWSGPNIKDIKNEDNVITVSDIIDGKNTIRTITITSK